MNECPSCGRYVGPYEACPYCGARLTGRVPIRVVKIAAILLASVGLIILWVAATRSSIPLIQIGHAEATMNMAYARVEGRVVQGPTYYVDSGYLSFSVDDGTGEIRVSAYSNETQALQAEGRIPALGDQVRVAGTLRVREDDVALTLNVPEHLEIARPEAEAREIGSVTPEDHLQRVRVAGQVWGVHQPYEGLTLITLRDATGMVEVAVDQSLELLTGGLLPVEPGQSVEVRGAVDLYQDTVQIIPAAVADIVLLPEPVTIAPEVDIGELTTEDAAQLVTVQGVVTEINPFSAGLKFTLDDGTGSVTVLLWQDIYDGLEDSEVLTSGAQVRVLGEVSVYRGELEVIPERTQDVEVLASGVDQGEEEPTQAVVPLDDLTADQVGETVTVEGEVVDVSSFSAGFRFTLDDGTGQGVLLLWLSIYDELADPGDLNQGARVRAIGEVEEYEGALQIAPSSQRGVTILSPGSAERPLRDIDALTSADVGSLVTINGLITRAEPFSSGYRFWVDDGTGEVMVLLWDTIYDRVPAREGLIAGAQVHITGVVEEYEGMLEVVPRLPVDVIVGER